MKKNYQKWLVGALACALAMPFTGCSGEDDPTPSVKPGTGETFQTEISIALTNGTSKTSTKASDKEVQEPDNGVIQFNVYRTSNWYLTRKIIYLQLTMQRKKIHN